MKTLLTILFGLSLMFLSPVVNAQEKDSHGPYYEVIHTYDRHTPHKHFFGIFNDKLNLFKSKDLVYKMDSEKKMQAKVDKIKADEYVYGYVYIYLEVDLKKRTDISIYVGDEMVHASDCSPGYHKIEAKGKIMGGEKIIVRSSKKAPEHAKVTIIKMYDNVVY